MGEYIIALERAALDLAVAHESLDIAQRMNAGSGRKRDIITAADACHSASERLWTAAREFARAERDERARAILDATKETP